MKGPIEVRALAVVVFIVLELFVICVGSNWWPGRVGIGRLVVAGVGLLYWTLVLAWMHTRYGRVRVPARLREDGEEPSDDDEGNEEPPAAPPGRVSAIGPMPKRPFTYRRWI